MEHLFAAWQSVRRKLSGTQVILLLDYDGTLAPIRDTPGKALLPYATKKVLTRLKASGCCKIAIISGRALRDVKKMVDIQDITYVGNHGLQIEGPKIKFESPLPYGYAKLLGALKDELTRKLSCVKGVVIEDKGLSLSVHYRLVAKGDIALVKTIFHETIIVALVSNKIKIRPGKKVHEIRPPVSWDKGKSVLWLLARYKFMHNNDVTAVYMGDDASDEDAFKALQGKGITVAVGKAQDSNASYYLRSPVEVKECLSRIAQLCKEDNGA
jgi:trehalose 6-phosphate phosphatase